MERIVYCTEKKICDLEVCIVLKSILGCIRISKSWDAYGTRSLGRQARSYSRMSDAFLVVAGLIRTKPL